MGIQTFFKRAFGFSVEELDEDGNININSVDSQMIPTLCPVADAPAPAVTSQPLGGPLPDDMPVEIIDGILAVVNESLPSLVRDCLDRDAQRMRLYQAMGESFKKYVGRLASAAGDEARNAVNADRARLKEEIEKMAAERKQIEQKRDEQREQILSEQRQRRALTERLRDMEAKMNTFDAEREQYQLEVQSLVNKLRVADVRESDEAELRAEIERLGAEVRSLAQDNARLKDDVESKDREINELSARINEMESAAVLDAAIERRNEMLGVVPPVSDESESAAGTDNEPAPSRPKRRRGRPRKDTVAAAESDTDIDWLLPGGAPASAGAGADSDFGYQPPQRTLFHEDDNQPTLF
ncbi:MAG: hypothetical protein K2F82_01745 [Muribaculaceae bacterium]|nr:hypothetical protein [Muribaculaceae bacterium]